MHVEIKQITLGMSEPLDRSQTSEKPTYFWGLNYYDIIKYVENSTLIGNARQFLKGPNRAASPSAVALSWNKMTLAFR